MVATKQFRADLYYRLCVFPIVLPPLRDRAEDVPALADHFLELLARELGRTHAPTLSPSARAALASHAYPGNVRELRNLLERALVRCRETELDVRHLALGGPRLAAVATPPPAAPETTRAPAASPAAWDLPIDLAELERLAILEALRRVGGNRTHAARLLGISLRTLRNKLRLWRTQGAAFADGQNLPGLDGEAEDDVADASEATLARSSHRDTERAA
jgi:DNA-binding NtrC family response regulator